MAVFVKNEETISSAIHFSNKKLRYIPNGCIGVYGSRW